MPTLQGRPLWMVPHLTPTHVDKALLVHRRVLLHAVEGEEVRQAGNVRLRHRLTQERRDPPVRSGR